jgi:hypothetical protein
VTDACKRLAIKFRRLWRQAPRSWARCPSPLGELTPSSSPRTISSAIFGDRATFVNNRALDFQRGRPSQCCVAPLILRYFRGGNVAGNTTGQTGRHTPARSGSRTILIWRHSCTIFNSRANPAGFSFMTHCPNQYPTRALKAGWRRCTLA